MKIKIISVPAGGAPLKIREQWVGVELEIDPVIDQPYAQWRETGIRSDGLIPADVENPDEPGFPVWAIDAISSLRLAGKEEAARYWEDLFEERQKSVPLVFVQRHCEVVEE